MIEDLFESDNTKLQSLAIKVDKILREEIDKSRMRCEFEVRIYNIRTVGVQGDKRTYEYPAEITIKSPAHDNGASYTESEFYEFLEVLSTRVTNEVDGVNRVVYVTDSGDEGVNLFKS